jgi:tetratricopeptide (TPR) repeat protein
VAVWSRRANVLLDHRDWAGAATAYRHQLEASEQLYTLDPANLDASRNLSLVLKQLGATLEMQNSPAPALELYRRAQALDEARVAADPSRPIWRLDLSFAHGAIGAALMAAGDDRAALEQYERAVALRQSVAAADPRDDFAQVSLARGFERLATIHARLGDVRAAVEASKRRVAIYRQRQAAHPERDHFWREFTTAAFSAADRAVGWLEEDRTNPAFPDGLALVDSLLEEVDAARRAWLARGGAETLPPSAEDLTRVRARRQRLAAR